jgi:putative DNA primase/helicase
MKTISIPCAEGARRLDPADTARKAAERYTNRGWHVIPIPHRTKCNKTKGWEQWRIMVEELDEWFPLGRRWNLGVLLGEPSNWLIDVDLDHQRAVELAPEYLPTTPLIFGRPGKPKSHYLYRVTKPCATKRFPSRSSGMIVEVRSTGAQTVFPPSTHESGEPIEWIDETQQPAEVDPDELLEAAKRLAVAVKIELGERAAPKRRERPKPPTPEQSPEPVQIDMQERAKRCFTAVKRIKIVDSNDGSRRLFAAACRCVEHDLDDDMAVRVIQEYARRYPFQVTWSREGILKRLRDAEKRCQRGQALLKASDGCIALGSREPVSGRLVLSPSRTLPTAKSFVSEFHTHSDGQMLMHYAGLLMQWRNNHYAEVEDGAAKQTLQAWLHDALRYQYNSRTKALELVDFASNPSTVRSALESIKAHVHLPASTPCPSWLENADKRPRPEEIVACRSQLLHLPTMERLKPTPMYFNTCALDFDPDPDAPKPQAWLEFLHQLVDGDIQSFDLIQQWFGYALVGDTSQQKMLLIVGPRRSGKGTIARVLAQIVGSANVCGPTTSSLAGPFGLQPLIGKSLAIVSDARFSGEGISTVVERLLCISGEDQLTVDRKNISSVTLKLPTRFMFLTNEFPRFNDASGALAGRFVILRLTESFYGREDTGLTQKLLAEKSGILNWAIEGWHMLREAGRFVTPQNAEDAAEAIRDLSSPVGAFVRQRCDVGPEHRVDIDALYEAWRDWCIDEGRTSPTTRQSFGRDLTAAVDGIARRRGTNDVPFYAGIRLKNSTHRAEA